MLEKCFLCLRVTPQKIISAANDIWENKDVALEKAKITQNIIRLIYEEKPAFLCGKTSRTILASIFSIIDDCSTDPQLYYKKLFLTNHALVRNVSMISKSFPWIAEIYSGKTVYKLPERREYVYCSDCKYYPFRNKETRTPEFVLENGVFLQGQVWGYRSSEIKRTIKYNVELGRLGYHYDRFVWMCSRNEHTNLIYVGPVENLVFHKKWTKRKTMYCFEPKNGELS